jgi:hypothetical protein
LAKSGAGALLVGGGQFFNSRRNQLIGLAALHAIPASYFESTFVSELPTKFELAINLKTAKTLGLTVPPALVARAEEVIQ